MDFDKRYSEYLDIFNSELESFCGKLNSCRPSILAESMIYSLTVGGKRIRPVLAFATGDLLGVPLDKLKGFALAIELIHTYSLIHDDLPEMDNDDFRRGKPSNHKAFGTGNAVLAGDGLLNTAYSLLLNECRRGNEYVSASEFVCDCAGIFGMIAGQSADLMHEGDKSVNEPTLDFIYENKTAKLITAPIMVPSILEGGKYYSELKSFGSKLGFLFQLTDDILDVEGEFSSLGKTIGKDKTEGKYTAVSLYGLEASKIKAEFLARDCQAILEGFDGDISFLQQLVNYVLSRKL